MAQVAKLTTFTRQNLPGHVKAVENNHIKQHLTETQKTPAPKKVRLYRRYTYLSFIGRPKSDWFGRAFSVIRDKDMLDSTPLLDPVGSLPFGCSSWIRIRRIRFFGFGDQRERR